MLNKRLTAKDFIGLHISQIDIIHRYRIVQKGKHKLMLAATYIQNRWNFKVDDNYIIYSASKG